MLPVVSTVAKTSNASDRQAFHSGFQGKACMADSIPEAVEMEHMATCQLFVSGCGCHLFSADDADIVTFQVSRSSIHKHFIHVCRHTPERSHVHMTFRYHDLTTCITGCNRSMNMCSGFCHTAALLYGFAGHTGQQTGSSHLYRKKSTTLFLKLRKVQYKSRTCTKRHTVLQ